MRQAAAAVCLLLFGWSVPAAAATAPCDTIVYRPDDRLINIPVFVDGSQLWFDVDTGARYSVIDLAAAKRLGLLLIKPARMSGAGHGTAELLHTSPLVLRAGTASVHVADPWVLDLSHTGTSRRIDGLVGVDFFKAYVVRIDPDAKTIAFCRGMPAARGPAGATIPLIVTNDRFFINLRLTLPNGIAATHR
ncbi:MAG TPA: retropepsin-like aspartic protease, partial [Candidatus Cybelea sp.]